MYVRTPAALPIEYILAVPGRRYGEFAEGVRNTPIQDGIGETTWQSRRLVVAHDEARAQAQHAARRETMVRIVAEGERLAKRLDDADAGRAQRGRKSTDRRAYLRFSEEVKAAGLSRILKADLNADRFSFGIDEAAIKDAEQLDGKLLLVTNTDFSPGEVIDRYKALADIERGFRVLKSDDAHGSVSAASAGCARAAIEIAPVHHRLPERIRAHALICFLALVLYRVMRERLRASNHPLSPRRAMALLRQIQKHHVVIDRQSVVGTGRVAPDQRDLFRALKLDAPTEHAAL